MNIEMIEAAAARLKGHAVVTPLLSSPFLDQIAGRRVLVKAECLQRTGSFKFRGGWSAITALSDAERSRGVIAFSSGNHAQGVAHAAQMHGVPATIVMPADAPQLKIENTRAYGAEVVLYDRATESREEIGEALARERGLTLIKPYDDPQVIAGQGTIGLEIAAQAGEAGVDAAHVLVCCGGGGMTAGISLALAERAPGMRVHPVEPVGFDDVAKSLASGQMVSNPSATGSICDAIISIRPGDMTLPIMRAHCSPGLTVTDDDAMRAMALAFQRLKIVLEPGGAVALAAALFYPETITGDAVICVASGGNVDPHLFAEALTKHG